MYDVLKLVRAAVADRDIVPVLTHYLIDNGVVFGSNGRISISATCDVLADMQAVVPADAFLKALATCEGEPKVTVTDNKVVLRHKRTRITLPTLPYDSFPKPVTLDAMKRVTVDASFMTVLQTLRPFVGSDAMRMWSHGVLLRQGHAYATNNLAIVCIPTKWKGPDVVVPSDAVDELLGVGKRHGTPVVWANANAVRFVWDQAGVKLTAQVMDLAWPDVSKQVQVAQPIAAVPIGLAALLERLAPMADDSRGVDIGPDGVACGAAVDDTVTLHTQVRFNVDVLRQVLQVATHVDFDAYPAPCHLVGDQGLTGAVVGVRAWKPREGR